MGDITVSDYANIIRPQLRELWSLHNYLPKDIDFFLTLSPLSSMFGRNTQVTNTASSAFLDSFASYRGSLGLPAVNLHLDENSIFGESPELMAPIKSAILNPMGAGSRVQIITGLSMELKSKIPTNFGPVIF